MIEPIARLRAALSATYRIEREIGQGGMATVFLATDLDREGEAIAWHVAEVAGVDTSLENRVVFSEITRDAIQRSLEEAELMAGCEINNAYIGVAGNHVRSFNSSGVVSRPWARTVYANCWPAGAGLFACSIACPSFGDIAELATAGAAAVMPTLITVGMLTRRVKINSK